eukprot:Nk52_evm20s215 gene=Nk52_evmTU20s215
MTNQPQIVKFKSGKLHFEVLCNPGVVLKWRKDDTIPWDTVLFSDTIFKNYHAGEKANHEDLKTAFDTTDVVECLKKICSKGVVNESQGERKEKVDKRRKEIVNYLHKYFINPKTSTPHPVERIQLALEEAKIKIDAEESVERQANTILKKLVSIIPMKKCEMEATLSVNHKNAGSVTGIIHKYAQIRGEKWGANGCEWELSLVPGDYDGFFAELTRAAKGEFEFNVAGGHASAPSTPSEAGGKKKEGKKGKKGRK